jgi:hypothetical protein
MAHRYEPRAWEKGCAGGNACTKVLAMSMSMPRRLALISVASSVAVSAVALGSAPVGATPQHPALRASAAVTTANLMSVAVAPRSSTAWAMGGEGTQSVGDYYALRRTGNHWSKVAMSGTSTAKVQLFAVAAGSPRSAWIVGNVITASQPATLIEHSTGGAFTPVKTTLGEGQLLSASASSPSNVWATGDGRTAPGPYIVHWNGKTWKVLPTPKLTGYSFRSVSASSASNVWFLGSGPKGLPAAAVWNGHKLRVMTVHVPASTSLGFVATTGPKNTWAVGSRLVDTNTSPRDHIFTEHWNGKSWKAVSAPTPTFTAESQGVAAAGSRVYLAGTGQAQDRSTLKAFILRFAGGKWKVVPSADHGALTQLNAIGVSTKGGAAVGYSNLRGSSAVHPTQNQAFVENLIGTSWHLGSAPKFRRRT